MLCTTWVEIKWKVKLKDYGIEATAELCELHFSDPGLTQLL